MGHTTPEAQLLNLVRCCTGRVSNADIANNPTMSFLSRLSIEERNFSVSYWLGVGLLLQSRPCSPGCLGPFKRLLLNVLKSSDILGFIDDLSELRFEVIQTGRLVSDTIKCRNHRWVKSLIEALSGVLDLRFCIHPCRDFDVLVTFLGWLKRLPVSIRAESISIEHYKDVEARISSIDFDKNVYVPGLAAIWHEWFRSFEIKQPFVARHGSGSTADAGRVRSRKWDRLSRDRAVDICFKTRSYERVLDWLPMRGAKRVSKVVFVPKQAGKDRTISMEPAWLQFIQQGLASQLIEYTHNRSHALSKLVNIFEQDVNRSLCARAYIEGFSTIDLSDASDSVSWSLINKLTHRLPLQRYLYASRSTHTNLRGELIEICKFAPMGSALCFPIECILFASIVELAHRIHYGKAGASNQRGCSVYGDDIICPREIYNLVLDILQSLGFIVNGTKSFDFGPYFESCGVEYLYGCRINTVRHPRALLLSEKDESPEKIGLVTDLANTLLSSGYPLARRLLLKLYEDASVRIGNRRHPFFSLVDFSNGGLISINETVGRKHWDNNLQCSVTPVKRVKPLTSRDRNDYVQWLYDSQRRVSFGSVPHPKWSEKGISSLLKLGHYDLLVKGEIEEARTCRTGRTHYVIRRKTLIA